MPERVVLTGAAETMLGTLYARALDAGAVHPVLADPTAVEVVAGIDYDFRRLGITASMATSVAARAKLLDRWAREFLADHRGATVLHLGCGLDDRAERLDPGPDVAWFDVDVPEVIELRRRLHPARDGRRMIAASVTDPAWLAEVPRDRPGLVVAEGLTMYLPAAAGPPLLRRLVAHFPSGEMAVDTFGRVGVRLSGLNPVLRRSGARMDWTIDDPHDLERLVPGLRVLASTSALEITDPEDLAHAPRAYRWSLPLLARLPVLRRWGRVTRFAFGP